MFRVSRVPLKQKKHEWVTQRKGERQFLVPIFEIPRPSSSQDQLGRGTRERCVLVLRRLPLVLVRLLLLVGQLLLLLCVLLLQLLGLLAVLLL